MFFERESIFDDTPFDIVSKSKLDLLGLEAEFLTRNKVGVTLGQLWTHCRTAVTEPTHSIPCQACWILRCTCHWTGHSFRKSPYPAWADPRSYFAAVSRRVGFACSYTSDYFPRNCFPSRPMNLFCLARRSLSRKSRVRTRTVTLRWKWFWVLLKYTTHQRHSFVPVAWEGPRMVLLLPPAIIHQKVSNIFLRGVRLIRVSTHRSKLGGVYSCLIRIVLLFNRHSLDTVLLCVLYELVIPTGLHSLYLPLLPFIHANTPHKGQMYSKSSVLS
mmetsp:Transcript_31004/g.118905  ORF Transcript_31004/g.118905 Transcript_31004/m.118905 type:complete len:272 (+) Transcript_31004:2257-3072(+)